MKVPDVKLSIKIRERKGELYLKFEMIVVPTGIPA